MLSDIQNKLLNMLNWFHNYCVDNSITYYCIGGTVLGAARHAGFIPWDDDIDIGIPRDDYNKLIRSFPNDNGKYLLESTYSDDATFLFTYSKLYDTSTTLIEKSRIPCKRGIYIDLFPLDAIGNTEEEALKNFKRLDRKKRILMSRTCSIRKERKWYKNISILALGIIPDFIINNKKLAITIDKIANSIDLNCRNSIFVANLSGAYRIKEITKRAYFGKPVLYKFENISIFGPEKYEEYLTHIYGDWRKLPPVEKRKSLHDYVVLDLNHSYLE